MVRLHDSQANRPTEAQQEDLAVRQTCEEFAVQRGLDLDPIFLKASHQKKSPSLLNWHNFQPPPTVSISWDLRSNP